MDKKILAATAVFVIAAISLVAYLMNMSATKVPESIKIGWPSPLTGPLASFGEADPWLAKKITEIVNEKNGGIYVAEYGKKIPIEILIRDTNSDENIASSVAEELIVDEKIDLMLVMYTPGTTLPVSSMCEKHHVPCIVLASPVLSWLSQAPYEWSYLHFWTEPDLVQMYVGMWDQVETNKKVGGLWNDDPDGKTFREATISAAKERGYEFVGDAGFSPYGAPDYSSYIRDWMEKDVEILTGVFIPPDFATLRRQMDGMGFHPKVVTIAKAILFPPSVEELGGDLPLGLTTEVWASRYHPGVSSLTGLSSQDLAELWEKESGKQWTQPLFYSHGAFEIALDVLERAESLEKQKIRNAIADTDLDTTIGHVSFKAPLSPEDKKRYEKWPKLIEYKSHYSLAPVVGGQWVKGTEHPWEIQIVFNWKYDEIPQTSEMVVIPK